LSQLIVYIRAKAKSACEQCGVVLEGRHIHNRKATGSMLHDFDDIGNLTYLCALCHLLAHITMFDKGKK